MSQVSALVVGIDRDAGFGPMLLTACMRSGIEPSFDGGLKLEGELNPQIIVGALGANSRSIPDDIVRLGDRHPTAAIVLLCVDRLVRPTVSLQRGRVLLLSPPHDVASVSRRLRQALWKVRQEAYLDTAQGLNAEAEPIQSQIRVSSRYWAGMLSSHRSDMDVMRSSTVQPSDENVLVALTGAAGFVDPLAVLPEPSATKTSKLLVEASGALPPGVMVAGLFGASEWALADRNSGARVWLVSPLRFPTVFSLSDRMQRYEEASAVIPALTGDVLIVSLGDLGDEQEDLRVALASGGLGYHDSVRARRSKETKSILSLAVEVI
jgi:hypothetical protein